MSHPRIGRRRNAAGLTGQSLEEELAALNTLTKTELTKVWEGHFGTGVPPTRSAALLRRLLAWRIQIAALGGFDAVTERKLRDIAKALERDSDYEPKTRTLRPGVVLTREWKGVVQKVTVVADGFQHQGKRYRSLSDIARTITGTRWSGPRFFGLEQKKARRAAGVPS